MADYFPLLSRTIASLGNSTPEQRQIVYERARSVVADQLSAIEPPMDNDSIKRELSLFEASVMRLEHEMQSLEAIKPKKLTGETETRKNISARLSALLAKAAASRATTTQELLRRDIEPADRAEGSTEALSGLSTPSYATPLVTVERVPEPVSRAETRFQAPMAPQVVERNKSLPSTVDDFQLETALPQSVQPEAQLAVTSLDAPEPSTGLEDKASVSPTPETEQSTVLADTDSLLAVADAPFEGKSEDKAPDGGPDHLPLAQPASQTSHGSLSRFMVKTQDFWQKKPSSTDGLDHVALPGGLAGPQEIQQPDLLAQDSAPSPSRTVEEMPKAVLPSIAGEGEFAGPMLPMAEASETQDADAIGGPTLASTDIVFSDDVVSTGHDAQGELPLVSTPKPAPASEIELLDDGRPRLAQRRKRDRGLFRGLVMGLAFVSVIGAVAGTAWVLRDRPADFEQGSTAARGDLSRKITDRLPSDPVVASSQPGEPVVAGGAGVALSGQRVMLFEEAVEGQPAPAPVVGRVTWALETIRDQTGAGDVAIKADIKALTGSLSAVVMVIKRAQNLGYLIELTFVTPDSSPNGRVRDIDTPEMLADEGSRRTSLKGLSIPVTDNAFLVGLNNLPDQIEHNRDLLGSRNWIVIPMRFANGRRAELLVEKGLAGDRVLLDAFQAWK